MNKNSTNERNEKKLNLTVMIEGGRSFTDEFVNNQKIQVIINKASESLKLGDVSNRLLYRGDGTIIENFSLTIEEYNFRDNEVLKFMLKDAPIPDEPKKFA